MRAAIAPMVAVVLSTAALPAPDAGAGQGRVVLPPPPARGAAVLPAWPPPPAAARIRFVRSLDPQSVRGKPSAWSRVLKVIVGGSDEPAMALPYGVAAGPDGLYVVDASEGVIHVFGLDSARYRSIRVDGASLIGIAFIGQQMFVTDSVEGRVRCLDLQGRTRWTLGRGDGLLRPTGIVADQGRLFVVDTLGHRVVSISPAGVIGPGFGRRGVGAGELNFPTSIAADGGGKLYVTDTMNFRVQVFDRDGLFVNAFGRLGDSAGEFDKPKGIAVDGKGRVYVVEGLHDVVQIFQPDGQLLLAFGGSGHGPGQMWLPTGIALAGSSVYVADSANRRVQVFERLGEAR